MRDKINVASALTPQALHYRQVSRPGQVLFSRVLELDALGNIVHTRDMIKMARSKAKCIH